MKRVFFVCCLATTFIFSANAQLGKSLKNVGKSVTKAVGDAAGELAADAAANQVSANVIAWMDNNNNLAPGDSEYFARLASIVTPYVNVDGLVFNYHVYLTPEINILACADGSIRIYSGMMDILTDDEILAVVATQIGHIVNKDVRNSLMKVATGNNAGNATAAQLEKMLSLSGEKMGSVVNELIQIPYTDNQNKAADKYAVVFLESNNKESEALISALSKFAILEENDRMAEEDDTIEISFAAKYTKVNSNNAIRAQLLQ